MLQVEFHQLSTKPFANQKDLVSHVREIGLVKGYMTVIRRLSGAAIGITVHPISLFIGFIFLCRTPEIMFMQESLVDFLSKYLLLEFQLNVRKLVRKPSSLCSTSSIFRTG